MSKKKTLAIVVVLFIVTCVLCWSILTHLAGSWFFIPASILAGMNFGQCVKTLWRMYHEKE